MFYKRNQIVFKGTKTVYLAAKKDSAIRQAQRLEFTHKLVSLMIAKRKIIFVDETSFRAWSTPKQDKTWQAPN